MPAPFPEHMPDGEIVRAGYAAPRRSRAVSFGLALIASVLVFATMVGMGAFTPVGRDDGTPLTAIDLGQPSESKRAKSSPQTAKAKQHAQARPTQARPPVPPRVIIPNTEAPQLPPDFIRMSRKDFAAADISKMARADPGAGSGSGSGAGADSAGAGEGPGGARLYNAQWYREPTDAELVTYMPQGSHAGAWALIMCRTVAQFHVEDCQEMDESPRGSGLARALRRASWQFLVRPPRIDGKVMVGAWVKIRFDFRRGKGGDANASGG
ncbi:hypothetical protein [Novosphingobium sp.]|uniref:hypothetical protein n=1 Tax=Novosphingobium sp. TaxID=1874826 RepID=UPI00261AF701|nr:hypothetical protein [Novosphingobium sp.]